MGDKFCDFCDSKGFIHKKECTRDIDTDNEPVEIQENQEEVGKEVNEFYLIVPYNLPEVPSMTDILIFCLVSEGFTISLETYQNLPVEFQKLFQKVN